MERVLRVYRPESDVVCFLRELHYWVELGYASRAAEAIRLYVVRFQPCLHESVWVEFDAIKRLAAA